MATEAAKARAHRLLAELGESFVERVMLPIVRERLRDAGATPSAFARAVELVHGEGESPIAARLRAWFEWLAATLTEEQERSMYGMTALEREDAEWTAAWLREMRAAVAESPAVRALVLESSELAAELGLVFARPAAAPPAIVSTQGGMPL